MEVAGRTRVNYYACVNVNAARTKGRAMEHQGRKNLLHAYSACDDPDCEIHNPEVIEDHNERRTAKAWYVVAMYEMQECIQAALRCDADPWEAIDQAVKHLQDDHKLREFVIEEDKAR